MLTVYLYSFSYSDTITTVIQGALHPTRDINTFNLRNQYAHKYPFIRIYCFFLVL